MKHFVRFATFMGILLLSLFLVGYGVIHFSKNQAYSLYQTELVKSLNKSPAPILWKQAASSKTRWVQAQYKDKQWVATNSNESLDNWFNQSKNRTLLLMIKFDSPTTLPALREILKVNNRWQNTVVCSRADGILKDLRALEPTWTFCSGEVMMTRMLSLTSLSIAGLNSLMSDVFFIHSKNISIDQKLAPVIEAAKKQNKLVFIGPVPGPTKGLRPDGWVIKP